MGASSRPSPNHLTFRQMDPGSRKTRIVYVYNTRFNTLLGYITWHGPWRQYVFTSLPDRLYNPDCLRQLAERCQAMTQEHRAALAAAKADART